MLLIHFHLLLIHQHPTYCVGEGVLVLLLTRKCNVCLQKFHYHQQLHTAKGHEDQQKCLERKETRQKTLKASI